MEGIFFLYDLAALPVDLNTTQKHCTRTESIQLVPKKSLGSTEPNATDTIPFKEYYTITVVCRCNRNRRSSKSTHLALQFSNAVQLQVPVIHTVHSYDTTYLFSTLHIQRIVHLIGIRPLTPPWSIPTGTTPQSSTVNHYCLATAFSTTKSFGDIDDSLTQHDLHKLGA